MTLLFVAFSAVAVLLPILILAGRLAIKYREQREWLFVTLALALQFIWCSLILAEYLNGQKISGHDSVSTWVRLIVSLASLLWVVQLYKGQKGERAAKDKLVRGEANWRLLFEKSSDAIFIFESGNRISDVNDKACQLLGYSRSEMMTLDPVDVFHVSTRSRVPQEMADVRRGVSGLFRHKMIRKDGSIAHVELSASPMPDGRLIAAARNITERVTSEERLAESYAMLSQASQLAKIGYFTLDLRTNTVSASEEIYRLTEIDLGTALHASDLFERTHPEDISAIQEAIARAISSHQFLEVQYRAKVPSGVTRYLHALGKVTLDESGQPESIVVAVQDISDHKFSEQEFQKSEERFRRIFEASPIGLCMVSLDNKIISPNPAFCDMLGYSVDELAGTDVLSIVHPDDLPQDRYLLDTLPATQHEEIRISKRLKKKDNSYIWIELTATTVRDRNGIALHGLGIIQDLSERRKSEEALASSEGKYRAVIETTGTGFGVLDDAGRLVEANPEYLRLTGHRALDQILGRSVVEWTVKDLQTKNSEAVQRCLRLGSESNFETEYVGPTGVVTPVEINATVIHSEGRSRILALCRDISKRRHSEEALKNSERLHRSLVNLSPDGIFIYADGQIVFANDGFVKLLKGTHQNDLLGLGIEQITVPDFWDQHYRRMSSIGRRIGQINPLVETKMVCCDGSSVDVEVTSVLINWKDRPAAHVIVRDITARRIAEQERSRLEEQLRLSQKLETIGTLAAGIAHDFNNLLVPIIGYTELTASMYPHQDVSQGHLSEILRAAYRAKSLVAQILSFSRQQHGEMKNLLLGQIVHETVPLFRSTFPSGIKVIERITDTQPIWADPTQLHEAIMNLAVNASHSMPNGGIIVISSDDFLESNLSCPGCGKIIESPHVHLQIQDTGCGIDRETQKRIFDPFFTTKPVGQGTGLGLAVTHGIITQHNGHICVVSEPGLGSTFHLMFPISEGDLASDQAADLFPIDGTESILLVDDEREVAQAVADVLESSGYSVTIETNPRAAIELFKADPNRFDLVLADYLMPELTGDQLAVEILRTEPEIPIVILSGHHEATELRNARGIGIYDVLIKPVPIRELHMALRKTLSSNSRRSHRSHTPTVPIEV